MDPYTARDVGRFTILKALDRKMYLSMSQLCNIMVLSWMHYYARTGCDMFDVKDIRGWGYGVKIRDVWRDWSCSCAKPLFCSKKPQGDLASDRYMSDFIEEMLDRYGELSTWESRDLLG